MEIINLTKQDIPDFKQFLATPNVECIRIENRQNFVELIYNTDQKFVLDKSLYETIFPSRYSNDLIFGKDKTENIVSVELEDDKLILFKETEEGVVKEERPATYWFITRDKKHSQQTRLTGDQHYKWLAKFNSYSDYMNARKKIYSDDHYKMSDIKESALVYNGITYFKNMTVGDVSALSFDIESDGLKPTAKSEIYLITNTFRKKDYVERKTFNLAEYPSQADMLTAWVNWVNEKDPSILLGHNILSYDIPYILHVAKLHGANINIGRNGSEPKIATYTSKFRKDGSQSYDYNNIWVYGREIVDTMFLSIKYDVQRNFESYALKSIISQLGLEKQGRSFVDAKFIKKYFYNRLNDPVQWAKVVQYAEEDSDDALKLYDKMAPSYFYFTQSVSKSWQQMINSATGSQMNNMMVRAYFQDGHSIAKTSEVTGFEGAISFGIPGLYKNVFKLDVASLYPSIILQYRIYNKYKDPDMKFLKIMEYFTIERLANKKKAAETGDKYYTDLEQAQKIVINSGYGFLGATGLNYNFPTGAAEVTRYGRDILNTGVEAATGKKAEAWKGEDETEGEDDDEAA